MQVVGTDAAGGNGLVNKGNPYLQNAFQSIDAAYISPHIDLSSGELNYPEVGIDSNPDMSDALRYGNLKGKSVEEQLQYLIDNDPDNRTGWLETLIGLNAGRENAQIARDNEEYIARNKLGWMKQALEENGINPILAYQYLNGSSSSSAQPGFSDTGVGQLEQARYNTDKNKEASDNKTKASIAAAVIAALALIVKAVI